ncbi:MAG TPA: glycine betaine ABC transporter substrate-binding protein [Gaiellaceae bacterium]|nr:glycine betaine ABC transporter substrate-binding protein [Gaiellaceae bacterium]
MTDGSGGAPSGAPRRRFPWALAAAAAAILAAAPAGAPAAAPCGTVAINEQAWAGSVANTYVAKAVLERYLGCTVTITQFGEVPAFQALADGKTDAVLEDWQHVAQYRQYVSKEHKAVLGGPNGVVGHIGWYVPSYLMQEHPELRTWKGLKGHESLVDGTFLGGDPSYVAKDRQLIQQLGLSLTYVGVKSEQAEVARWSALYRQRKPALFYWYTPQYLNVEFKLSEVALPPRFAGCVDNFTPGTPVKDYRCAYANEVLNKVFSAAFARSGSPAYPVLKRFSWSNDDQETVAKWIAGDRMNPDAAGRKWVAQNRAKVLRWLGR